jgi:hypothetical protein
LSSQSADRRWATEVVIAADASNRIDLGRP